MRVRGSLLLILGVLFSFKISGTVSKPCAKHVVNTALKTQVNEGPSRAREILKHLHSREQPYFPVFRPYLERVDSIINVPADRMFATSFQGHEIRSYCEALKLNEQRVSMGVVKQTTKSLVVWFITSSALALIMQKLGISLDISCLFGGTIGAGLAGLEGIYSVTESRDTVESMETFRGQIESRLVDGMSERSIYWETLNTPFLSYRSLDIGILYPRGQNLTLLLYAHKD